MRMLLACLVLLISSNLVQAEKIKVIATTSIIGDVVKNVAGDGIDLIDLVGPNGDAHEYEPIPADSVHLSRAEIIFENGLFLEHWLNKLYTASGSKAKRVIVSNGVLPRVFENDPKEVDPHAWQDVSNMIIYTRNICDALQKIDPAQKDLYALNAQNYIRKLQVLDEWVKGQVQSIPIDHRKLVTNHDALGYYAGKYGFQIIGAVIPSATTEAADPSARQTVDLLNIIRKTGVRAIFSENMADPKLARTLSQEAGVVMAPGLYTDALGPEGSDGDSYVKAIRYNTDVLLKYLK